MSRLRILLLGCALVPTLARADPFAPADLAQVRHLHQLAWSPDGETLVFTATPAESTDTLRGSRLWVVQPGRPALELPRNSDADLAGSFSPDGLRLVHLSRDARGFDQPWILDLGTRTSRPLTVFPAGVRVGPWWSPTGDQIVVAADRAGVGTRLVLLRPDHPAQSQLRFSDDVRALAWSPDGTRIAAVAADPTGELAVCVVSVADDTQQWVPLAHPWPETPNWSPAGDQILVRRRLGPATELVAWSLPEARPSVLSLGLEGQRTGPGVFLGPETVALPVEREGRRQLAAIDRKATGLGLRWLSSQLEAVADLDRPGRIAARPGPAGGVAYVRSSPRTPDEILLWDPALTRPRRLTLVHRELLRKGLSSAEARVIETAAGPVPVLLTLPSDPDIPPPYGLLWLPEPPGSSPFPGFDALAQTAAGRYVLAVRTPTDLDPLLQWERMDALLEALRGNNLVDATPLRVAGPDAVLAPLWAARNGSSLELDENRYNRRMPDHWLRLEQGSSPGPVDRSTLGKLDSWLQKP